MKGGRPPTFWFVLMTTKTTTIEALWDLLEPYLAAEHIELDDLELGGTGRATTLRLIIDAPGGIDLERITVVSRNVSRLLDSDTGLSGPYQLEVSSPGLERKLRRPAHFHKSVGRDAVAKLADGSGTLQGTIIEADESGFILKIEGVDRRVQYNDLVSAKTVYRWEKPQRPGRKD